MIVGEEIINTLVISAAFFLCSFILFLILKRKLPEIFCPRTKGLKGNLQPEIKSQFAMLNPYKALINGGGESAMYFIVFKNVFYILLCCYIGHYQSMM